MQQSHVKDVMPSLARDALDMLSFSPTLCICLYGGSQASLSALKFCAVCCKG